MSPRLLAVVLSLAALGFGCDSGSDSESGSGPLSSAPPPAEPGERVPVPGPVPPVEEVVPDVNVDDFLPEVVDRCRGAYGQLPAEEQAATTEDVFIVRCLAALSGRPDPLTGAPS